MGWKHSFHTIYTTLFSWANIFFNILLSNRADNKKKHLGNSHPQTLFLYSVCLSPQLMIPSVSVRCTLYEYPDFSHECIR